MDIIKKRNFVITLGKAEGDYKNRKDSSKSGRVSSYVTSSPSHDTNSLTMGSNASNGLGGEANYGTRFEKGGSRT